MRDRLLLSLQQRCDAATRTGDTAEILKPETAADAEALLRYLANAQGELDLEVLYTAGATYWLRAAAQQEEAGAPDTIRAVVLLMPLYLAQPQSLPELVRQSVAEFVEQAGSDNAHPQEDLAEAWNNVAMLLMEPITVSHDTSAAPTVVMLLRMAERGLPIGHHSRPMVLCNLGYALIVDQTTALATNDGSLLATPELTARIEEAYDLLREAFRNTPRNDLNYCRCANGLALALNMKAALAEDTELLAEANDLFRISVNSATSVDTNLPQILTNFGISLMTWQANVSEESSRGAAVDEAVDALRRAVELTDEHAREFYGRLDTLVRALLTRYDQQHAREDLLEAISVLRRTLAMTEGFQHAVTATRLGGALLEDDLHVPTDLNEPIALLEQATAALPEGSQEQAQAARQLMAAQLRQGSREDQARHRQARAEHGPSGVERLNERLGQLLATMGVRSDTQEENPVLAALNTWGLLGRSGGHSRHERDSDLLRAFMSDNVPYDRVVFMALNNLAARYSHLPENERVEALMKYLEPDARPEPTPHRRVDLGELHETAALLDQLLARLPKDDERRPPVRLARNMLTLVELTSDGTRPPNSEESVDLLLQSLEELSETIKTSDMPVGMAQPMMMLGGALLSPFESLAAIDETLRRNREKLAGLAEDDPDHLVTVGVIAYALFGRYALTSYEPEYREAVALTRRVAEAGVERNPLLIAKWGNAVANRARRISLLTTEDEDDPASSTSAGMASGNAAGMIGENDAPGALETLEDGRATMLSHALNARLELEAVRRIAPDLADEFISLRQEIQDDSNPGLEPNPGSRERSRARMLRWSELIDRLKQLSGFEQFMMPQPLGVEDLTPAAAEGPVVTINVNHRRCDALALCSDGVRLIPLPDLHDSELAEAVEAFRAATDAVSTPAGADSGQAETLLAGPAEQVIADTLAWLWDVLAEPVLSGLGFDDEPWYGQQWPRIWWSPTGLLNLLPLHAAGRHAERGASVLDRVASSYTPTIRALMHSRSRTVPRQRQALAVAVPVTPGQIDLPATAAEAAHVAGLFSGPPPLVGADATGDAVRAALPRANIAHFACHASSDPGRPALSHLLLDDGPLGIREISRLWLDNAELAYLSACATARGDAWLANNAIHAASAFQMAGYSQSIATLWEVGDNTAARVAAEFYQELAGSIRRPRRLAGALALHTVTRRMRERMPDRPSAWAAYVHAGA